MISPQTEYSKVLRAISIISEESGISSAELTDDTRFDDVGVDSLLGLMVSSRMRDELSIDFDSAAFLQVGTVGSFKTLIQGLIGASGEAVTTKESVQEQLVSVDRLLSVLQPITANGVDSIATWSSVLEIIAEESGIDVTELTTDTNFADIGLDSLLSLVVVSRMRDELNIDIPNQSLFIDYPTVSSLEAMITGLLQPSESRSEADHSDSSTDIPHVFTPPIGPVETPMEDIFDLIRGIHPGPNLAPLPPIKPAWSIILQGSPRNAADRLFLFPDGCGAATSYLKLPALSPSTAVIAFNSPFMK
jgi:acyl carrier protein